MRTMLESIGRGLGFAAVACTLALSLPGIQAVRADDAATPDASVSSAPDASFEGFADHLARKGRPVEDESAGPTCNAGSQGRVAVEMAQRRAIAEMQARMLADARARAAEGREASDIVVLNGRGYNYRSPEPGTQAAPQPGAPARQ